MEAQTYNIKVLFVRLAQYALVVCCLWCMHVSVSRAATVHVDPYEGSLLVGDEVSVTVTARSIAEDLYNTSILLAFSSDRLALRSIDTADAVFDFWITRPELVDDNAVLLEGVVFDGWEDGAGEVVTLVFEAIAAGDARVTIADASLTTENGGELFEPSVGNIGLFSINSAHEDDALVELLPSTPSVSVESEGVSTTETMPVNTQSVYKLLFDGEFLPSMSNGDAVVLKAPSRHMFTIVDPRLNRAVDQIPVLVVSKYEKLVVFFALTTIVFIGLFLCSLYIAYRLWRQHKPHANISLTPIAIADIKQPATQSTKKKTSSRKKPAQKKSAKKTSSTKKKPAKRVTTKTTKKKSVKKTSE